MMHSSDIQWWRTHSADYVLGLLSNAERLVFERIMPTEPELQEFVVEWREKLQPMSDALPPIQPPDHILPALIANITKAANEDTAPQENFALQENSASDDIFASDDSFASDENAALDDNFVDVNDSTIDYSSTQESLASTGSALVVASANTDSVGGDESSGNGFNSTEQTPDRTDLLSDRSRILSDLHNENYLNADESAASMADGTAFMRLVESKQKGMDAWRSYAGLATAVGLLVAALGWMGFQKSQSDSEVPAFDGISIMQNSDEKALWVVDSSAGSKKLRVTAVAPPELEEGQAFELWMVKSNDGGVVSMGLLPAKTNVSALYNAQRFSAEAESFGVSVESAKGSPESIPTGPILYQGIIQTLSN